MSRPATSLAVLKYRERLRGHQAVRRELREELLALPVPAFARLLHACGYQGVRVLGEARGGADLVASAPGGLCPALVLVQAKQYAAPVSRRFVDELRGALLRHNAQQGLLVTTSAFFGPARDAAALPPPLAVRLVDGEELLNLLLAHGLGVRASQESILTLNREFFAALVQEHDGEHLPPVSRREPCACSACGRPS